MARPRNGEALRLKLRLADSSLGSVVSAFWGRPDLPRLFPEFLFLVHSCIRASTPLMEQALGQARLRAEGDPVSRGLADYLERHIGDEDGHDDWLLEDLETLGLNRTEILARVPSLRAACMVGSQYYWIRHVHPVAILGYIAVLEGSPPAATELEAVQRRTGLPPQAFRTLLEHADLDVDHARELYALIDALPLTDAQSALVGMSALQTLEHMGGMFQDLLHTPGSSTPAGMGS
jgi:hypothetical protein